WFACKPTAARGRRRHEFPPRCAPHECLRCIMVHGLLNGTSREKPPLALVGLTSKPTYPFVRTNTFTWVPAAPSEWSGERGLHPGARLLRPRPRRSSYLGLLANRPQHEADVVTSFHHAARRTGSCVASWCTTY